MIRVTAEGEIDVVTMAGPRRNALSLEMIRSLIAALHGCSGRVVVLAADGPVFCAGHDLNEIVGCSVNQAGKVFGTCVELMALVQSIPQPVIAQVQGPALAAGCQLVAACDLALASDDAWFATPGVKIGLFCSTPMVALTRSIGRKRAMEMLLTARQVSAREAAEWGLINRAVPAESLSSATMDLALSVASASEYTVSLGKHTFHKQIDMPQDGAYRVARRVMQRNALADVAQEQMRGFLNKRGR